MLDDGQPYFELSNQVGPDRKLNVAISRRRLLEEFIPQIVILLKDRELANIMFADENCSQRQGRPVITIEVSEDCGDVAHSSGDQSERVVSYSRRLIDEATSAIRDILTNLDNKENFLKFLASNRSGLPIDDEIIFRAKVAAAIISRKPQKYVEKLIDDYIDQLEPINIQLYTNSWSRFIDWFLGARVESYAVPLETRVEQINRYRKIIIDKYFAIKHQNNRRSS